MINEIPSPENCQELRTNTVKFIRYYEIKLRVSHLSMFYNMILYEYENCALENSEDIVSEAINLKARGEEIISANHQEPIDLLKAAADLAYINVYLTYFSAIFWNPDGITDEINTLYPKEIEIDFKKIYVPEVKLAWFDGSERKIKDDFGYCMRLLDSDPDISFTAHQLGEEIDSKEFGFDEDLAEEIPNPLFTACASNSIERITGRKVNTLAKQLRFDFDFDMYGEEAFERIFLRLSTAIEEGIEPSTPIEAFRSIFTRNDNFMPVVWTGQVETLAFFVNRLLERNYIKRVKGHWQAAHNCFRQKDSLSKFDIESLKNSNHNIRKEHREKDEKFNIFYEILP